MDISRESAEAAAATKDDEEEDKEDENTDCKVYFTSVFLVVLCLTIVFAKIYVNWEEENPNISTFRPLEQQVNSKFK